MPDATTTGPPSGTGFGPRESADESRQSQQALANDAVIDVNMNSIIAREQGGTYVTMGKNFEASASRRNDLFDVIAAKIAARADAP
jgi:hypothetical protein